VTPGKSALQLRVVHDDGTPVGFAASLLRNLLRTADMFPFCGTVGIVAMLLHPEFRRLGDLAAGTVVVHVARPEPPVDIEDGPELAPGWSTRTEDRRAIRGFAARHRTWSPARRDEIARALGPGLGTAPSEGSAGEEPVVGDTSGLSPSDRVLAMARWLDLHRAAGFGGSTPSHEGEAP
jgi:hypothetical protein